MFWSIAGATRSTPADSSRRSRSALSRDLLGLWTFFAGGAGLAGAVAVVVAGGAAGGGAEAAGVSAAGAVVCSAAGASGEEGLRPPRGDGGADA